MGAVYLTPLLQQGRRREHFLFCDTNHFFSNHTYVFGTPKVLTLFSILEFINNKTGISIVVYTTSASDRAR